MLAFVVVRCAARHPLLSIDISSAGRPAANLPQRSIAWTGRQTDGQTDATTVPWLCSAYSARSVKRAGSVEDNAEDAVRWELFRCPLVRVTAIITRQPREYSTSGNDVWRTVNIPNRRPNWRTCKFMRTCSTSGQETLPASQSVVRQIWHIGYLNSTITNKRGHKIPEGSTSSLRQSHGDSLIFIVQYFMCSVCVFLLLFVRRCIRYTYIVFCSLCPLRFLIIRPHRMHGVQRCGVYRYRYRCSVVCVCLCVCVCVSVCWT